MTIHLLLISYIHLSLFAHFTIFRKHTFYRESMKTYLYIIIFAMMLYMRSEIGMKYLSGYSASRRAEIQLKIGNRDSTRGHSRPDQACFPKYWEMFIEQTHLAPPYDPYQFNILC